MSRTQKDFDCPTCGPSMSAVLDSRPCQFFGTLTTRRRRKCCGCSQNFTTVEIHKAEAEETARTIVETVQRKAAMDLVKPMLKFLNDEDLLQLLAEAET